VLLGKHFLLQVYAKGHSFTIEIAFSRSSFHNPLSRATEKVCKRVLGSKLNCTVDGTLIGTVISKQTAREPDPDSYNVEEEAKWHMRSKSMMLV
jgi:hypothetical protein